MTGSPRKKDHRDLGEPRLPVEVCESVIDRVLHPRLFHRHAITRSRTALSQCALVCRAWRRRAQMRLFYSVEFSTTYLLYTFAELLDESPLLATYVHVVLVHGSSHNTPGDSVLAFFPTVMGGRLPNLQEISVYGTGGVSERRYHGNPGLAAHARKRVLPHLPLHPCFPILLTGLRRLTKLRLGVLTFPSFGDLGRILHTFIELQSLVCDALDWSVLGIVPPCMIKGERTYFLPELSELKVTWMGIYGTKRLLAALGPSLTCLDIHVPYFIPRKIRTDDGTLSNLQCHRGYFVRS
ncbi:hypothetical protein C8T65DRAFT_574400 [Cerioporus squamosus]|nr:hypothetical protein C8T65DRAFT_574400 [Cerioporus squamosus]